MTNKMQLFGLFICTQSALYVSGDVFAHHQEHLTVFTVSDSTTILLPAGVMDEMELTFQLVHDIGRQQHRCSVSESVNIVNCSRLWAKTSPETCRANWVQINKPKSCILLVINYELY